MQNPGTIEEAIRRILGKYPGVSPAFAGAVLECLIVAGEVPVEMVEEKGGECTNRTEALEVIRC